MKYIREGVYPITERDIRIENPNVSFPKDILAEHVIGLGYEVVEEVEPIFNLLIERVIEEAPVFNNGAWRQVWSVIPLWDTLDDAKKDLKKRVTRKRNSIENSETIINGLTVNMSTESQASLNTLIRRSSRKPTKTFKFKVANGDFVALTANQVTSLHNAIEDRLDSLLDNESTHYAAINQLLSITAAQSYNIDTGWSV